ncbi:MAG: hypothetical protein M0R76_02985 [Proteobacteria bacterium]|nr:hypothetical protein [Pseudomonadota bacterium]
MMAWRVQVIFGMCLALLMTLMGCGGAQGSKTAANAKEGEVGEHTSDEDATVRYNDYMAAAGMALSEERLDDALSYYLSAAEVLDETGEVTIRRADAHYEAAGVAYQRYQKEMAIEQYQKAVEVYLRFSGNALLKAAVALTNTGVIWKELKDRARARTAWQQALEIYRAAPQTGQTSIHMQKVQANIQELDEGY